MKVRFGRNNNLIDMRALGRLKKGVMNKTEARYAQHLELCRKEGSIAWYKFEAFKLRLGDKLFLTPDFGVMSVNGFIECHDVKGFWTDDARAKMKMAAATYPFTFKAVKEGRGGIWKFEEF